MVVKKIIKNFYKAHKFILLTVVILTLFAIFINLFIAKERVFLVGEYVSSLDYVGHIKNIIGDITTDNTQLLNFTRCIDCPVLYQHNRWVALSTFFINQSGVYLGFHPFVWYVYLVITAQIVALYVFTKVLFKKFNPLAFSVGAFVLLSQPLLYKLFAGSVDGIINSIILLLLAEIIYFFKHIKTLSFLRTFIHAVLFGLLFSFFLNGGVYYFVVVVYGIIALCLYFYRSVIGNFAKSYIYLSIGIFMTVVINFPVIFSNITDLLLKGEMKAYSNYISYTFIDSLTALAKGNGMGNISLVIFFFIVIYLFIQAKIEKKYKILLVSVYAFLALFLSGENKLINIYDWAFSHMPFMQSMRSSYRFAIFQIIILFIIIYAGLISFSNLKKMTSKVIYGLCIAGIFSVNIYFLAYNFNFWHSVIIPQEYFQVKEYLKNNNEKKIYFPSYLPQFESMTNNYSWYNYDTRLRSLYPNPFVTIFALPNVILFESAELSIKSQELRVLTNYTKSPESIVQALEYAGIKYVIVDKNFNWQKNFPEFSLDEFTKNLTLEKQFGNISIYALSDKSQECKVSYGDYAVGYCFNTTNPFSYLINKTKKDYYLDKLINEKSDYVVEKNKEVRVISGIFSNDLQNFIIANNIALTVPVYEMDQATENVFKKEIGDGEYIFLIPYLSVDKETSIFLDTQIEVIVNNELINKINPREADYGLKWAEVEIPKMKDKKNLITINTKGQGIVLVGKPLLFTKEEWRKFNLRLVNDGYNPIILSLPLAY